jgi:hypothetical protein
MIIEVKCPTMMITIHKHWNKFLKLSLLFIFRSILSETQITSYQPFGLGFDLSSSIRHLHKHNFLINEVKVTIATL